jgi:hypothetical protein
MGVDRAGSSMPRVKRRAMPSGRPRSAEGRWKQRSNRGADQVRRIGRTPAHRIDDSKRGYERRWSQHVARGRRRPTVGRGTLLRRDRTRFFFRERLGRYFPVMAVEGDCVGLRACMVTDRRGERGPLRNHEGDRHQECQQSCHESRDNISSPHCASRMKTKRFPIAEECRSTGKKRADSVKPRRPPPAGPSGSRHRPPAFA